MKIITHYIVYSLKKWSPLIESSCLIGSFNFFSVLNETMVLPLEKKSFTFSSCLIVYRLFVRALFISGVADYVLERILYEYFIFSFTVLLPSLLELVLY